MKREMRKEIKRERKSVNWVIIIVLLILLILLIIAGFLFMNFNKLTGKVIFNEENMQTNYSAGEKLNGNIIIQLEQGDEIQKDTLINIQLKKDDSVVASKEISFNDFLVGQISPVEITKETSVCENVSLGTEETPTETTETTQTTQTTEESPSETPQATAQNATETTAQTPTETSESPIDTNENIIETPVNVDNNLDNQKQSDKKSSLEKTSEKTKEESSLEKTSEKTENSEEKTEKQEEKRNEKEAEQEQTQEEKNLEASASGQGITGNIIKSLRITGNSILEAFKGFMILTARVIGIDLNEGSFVENCTTQTTTDYYFNQAGSYSKDISELIDYTFSSSGNYKLIISSAIADSNEKDIVVSEGINLLQIGIMANGTAVDDSGSVYQCGTINQSGTYNLNQSFFSNQDCINITASNVILDGNNYTINYSANGTVGYGVYVNGFNNITIKNANIIEGTSNGNYKHAVYIINSNDSLIKNNTITTTGNYSYGIYLSYPSFNNTLTSNTILTTGYAAYAIYIFSSFNTAFLNNITTTGSLGRGLDIQDYHSNNLTLNRVLTTGSTATGIYLFGGGTPPNLNLITLNQITTTGLTARGFDSNWATNSKITQNTFNVSNADRIYLTDASNTNFTNNSIINRNYSYYDLNSANPGNNGNWFIDQYLENYTFAGLGDKINIMDSRFGEIRFIVVVNGSGTNFSNDIIIGNNSVYINSAQKGLNKSANVTLYNLESTTGYSNQKILRNGVECNRTTSPSCFNFTALTDSSVKFNVSSWSNYSIFKGEDITTPSVTLSSPTSGVSYSGATYSVLFVFDATDSGIGIANCSAYANSAGYLNTSAITATNNNITANLSAGTYTAYVNCTDLSNNIGNSSNITIIITAPAETSSGGGSATLPYWKNSIDTRANKSVDLTAEYDKNLGERERIIFTALGEKHSIGVVSISSSSDSAIIQIASNPVNVTFLVGEEKKFDLNKDNYYDLYVKLENITNKKASIVFKTIYEKLTEAEIISEKTNETQTQENPLIIIKSNDYWRMSAIAVLSAILIFLVIYVIYRIKKRNKVKINNKKHR